MRGCIAEKAPEVDFHTMAMRSKETIIDAALLRCGRSRTGGDANLLEVIEANYDEIVRAAFEDGDGNFPFGRKRETLTSRYAGTNGYADSYRMPDGVLQIIEVYFAGCTASDLLEPWDYDGVEGSILLNANGRTIEAEWVISGLEHTWSALFARGIQRRIEAVIKDALEEMDEAIAKDQEGDFAMLKAGVKASKNRSRRPFYRRGSGRLMRAHRTPDR